jgi:hypothetical protein
MPDMTEEEFDAWLQEIVNSDEFDDLLESFLSAETYTVTPSRTFEEDT